MVATTSLGLRYREPGDPPSLHDATQQLATDTNTQLAKLLNPPRAQIQQQTAVTNIANDSSFHQIGNMSNVQVDTIGLTVTTSLFTFPTGSAGKYEVSAKVGFSFTGAGVAAAAIYQNGSLILEWANNYTASSGVKTGDILAKEIAIADGDTFALYGYCDSASASTTLTTGCASYIRFRWVSAS